MSYIDEIFKRADIRQIREFLLYGVEEINTDPRPYKERLESAEKRMTARLHEEYPDIVKYEEITKFIYAYASALEEVYMEIGLQVGAKLTAQIYQSLKTEFEGMRMEKQEKRRQGD